AKVETQDQRGRTPLYRAAAEGKTDAVRLLLDKKADPNQKANDGSTPLLEAVTYAKMPVVRLLLERGAEVDQPDAQSGTPLIAAVRNGKLEAARLLLQRGADVNQVDAGGTSALMVAAEGNPDIKTPEQMISLLLEHKAKPDLVDNQGRTALARATAANNA